ncbi:hypothetical protein GOP47_0029991 [Adiantum capillus-veneris]|nr:hypothetical protein GOP47_0029991 [Adiantum capillus-veneris]
MLAQLQVKGLSVCNITQAAAESDQVVIKLLVPSSSNDAFVSHVCPSAHNIHGAVDSTCSFSGLAVEVFRKCAQRLPLPSYHFIPFSVYSYDDMLRRMITDQDVDGVVADLTITPERLKLVDFTYPYIPSNMELECLYLFLRIAIQS